MRGDTHARLMVPQHVAIPAEVGEFDTLRIRVVLTWLEDGHQVGANSQKPYGLGPLIQLREDRIMFYAWEIDTMIRQLMTALDLWDNPVNYKLESYFLITGGPPADEDSFERMFMTGGVVFWGRLPIEARTDGDVA